MEDWKIFNLILKALGKNENLSNFEFLRKRSIESNSKLYKLNELPSLKDIVMDDVSSDFVNEEINIKKLDYYFTNAISRSSKTMSECRQVGQSSKKLEQLTNDRIFTNLRPRNL